MPHPQARSAPHLKPVLTALLGVAIVVGGTIGVGILRTPGSVAASLGSAPLILAVWVAGGALALLGANCFAELATALPKAGGPFVYAERAFGPATGALIGWADFAISITALATISVAIAEFVLGGGAGFAALHVLAAATLLAFGLLNWFGLKAGARTQQLLSLAKVVGLVALALGSLAIGSGAGFVRAAAPGGAPGLLGIGAALVIVSETYAGWNSSVYLSEEDKDAPRNVPRALFWGVIAVTLTYVLFNAGLLSLLAPDELAAAELPAANVAGRLFGSNGGTVVRIFAILSLGGIINVIVMFSPRILYGMAKSGLAPAGLVRLNARSTPGSALIACLVPAILLASTLSFDILFAVTAFLGLAVNLACYCAFFALRLREPELERPFRAWGHPWLTGIVALVSFALMLAFVLAEPVPSAIAAAIIIAGWIAALAATRALA